MDDFELRLLTKEEVYVDENDSTKTTALEVFQNYRFTTGDTDLVRLLGCLGSLNDTFYHIQPDFDSGTRILHFMNEYGEVGDDSEERMYTIRPVLKFKNKKIKSEDLKYFPYHDLYKYTFGEYPQSILVDKKDYATLVNLNQKLCDQTLEKTGKTYCFYYGENYEPTLIRYGIEYLYDGKKYMPFTVNNELLAISAFYSGEEIDPCKLYWLKVEPITWLYDQKTGLLISERALVTGPGFSYVKEGQTFESTEMYEYLNNHLKQDIIPSRIRQEDKSSVLDGSEPLKKYVYKNYGRKG